MKHALLMVAAVLCLSGAPASARMPAQPALADMPAGQVQQAHHAPWHTGGRGKHLGWAKQKTKERAVGRALGRKKLR